LTEKKADRAGAKSPKRYYGRGERPERFGKGKRMRKGVCETSEDRERFTELKEERKTCQKTGKARGKKLVCVICTGTGREENIKTREEGGKTVQRRGFVTIGKVW